ncbi:hypothetical protein ANAEL_01673 [Anaerolineales bacterium]|nr:hypothetical protein ANAEL_01673 [Anaerolineales bacterium]
MAQNNSLGFFLWVVIIIMSLSACCGPIKSPQEVDVSPLLNAKIPEDATRASEIFNVKVFDSYDALIEKGEWTGLGENTDLNGIVVYFRFVNAPDSPADKFTWKCERALGWGTTDDFVFGGSTDNQFCVSYVNETRSTPDAFCVPTGEYQSFVVFQKGKLIITIEETSLDKYSQAKTKAINLLAQSIKE